MDLSLSHLLPPQPLSQQLCVWCLFSVDNDYNQPQNNLVAFWACPPPQEEVAALIGCEMTETFVEWASVRPESEFRYNNVDYRIQHVRSGTKVPVDSRYYEHGQVGGGT